VYLCHLSPVCSLYSSIFSSIIVLHLSHTPFALLTFLLRILHVHIDGKSISWKPALGEPHSSKKPPRLDLSTCLEVRHAWSPDPECPGLVGTSILRAKCELQNAHKSFSLIFPKRTVDVTAITADQCKLLMEGMSALCYRLKMANFSRISKQDIESKKSDDEVSNTVSARTVSPMNTP